MTFAELYIKPLEETIFGQGHLCSSTLRHYYAVLHLLLSICMCLLILQLTLTPVEWVYIASGLLLLCLYPFNQLLVISGIVDGYKHSRREL